MRMVLGDSYQLTGGVQYNWLSVLLYVARYSVVCWKCHWTPIN